MAFTTIPGTGGAPDSFVGSAGVDVLLAQNLTRPTVITALGADDIMEFTSFTGVLSTVTANGGDGDDLIYGVGLSLTSSLINGNAGADGIEFAIANRATVYGGTGNDLIDFGRIFNSLINGNVGNDTFDIFGDIESSSVFGGQGNDNIGIDVGEINTSFIRGNYGNDTITIVADGISDTVINGNENDDNITVTTDDFDGSSIEGGKDSDTITFTGDSDDSVINGGDGDDAISVTGGFVDSFINGNAGDDSIFIVSDSFEDSTVFGGSGDDTITAAGSTVDGVVIFGDTGDDTLTGSDVADTINGGSGSDVIIGGKGADRLTGGANADDFVNVGVAGGAVAADVITDFTVAQTDQVGGWSVADFTAIGATLTYLRDVVDVAAGEDVVVFRNAGEVSFDLGLATAGTNLLQLTTTFDDVEAVQARVRTFLAGDTTAADEGFLLSWDDGVNSYISSVDYVAIDNNGVAIADAVVTNLATLNGVAVNETLLNANFFAFVA